MKIFTNSNARSLGIVRPNWWINDMVIRGSIKRGGCVAAVNDNGELLAVRLGVVRDWDLRAWILDRILLFFLSFPFVNSLVMPEGMQGNWVILRMMRVLNFDIWSMFKKLNSSRLYEVKIIYSSVICK